jgi:hypothetical protein
MALLQDTTAIYACIIILFITPIIFRAIPGITSGAASGRATEGANGAAGHITTIVPRCAADTVIAVDGVVWVLAYPFISPGISYRAEVACQCIPDITYTGWCEP